MTDPFILTRAGSQALVVKLFARNNVQPKIAYELLQLMSILELVAGGKGISILAKLALPEHYPGIVFRPITPGASRHIGLACLNQTRLSSVAHAFWEEVRKHNLNRPKFEDGSNL